MIKQPFGPRYGSTVAAATAAAAVNVGVHADNRNLLLYNDGTGLVFIRVKPAGNTADATVADMPLPSKGSRVITKDGGQSQGSPNGQITVSVFSPGGAVGNVYICPGEGFGTT